MVTNIAAIPEYATDSDHAIVVADIRTKLTGSKRDREAPIDRYSKPGKNGDNACNDRIRDIPQNPLETHQRPGGNSDGAPPGRSPGLGSK